MSVRERKIQDDIRLKVSEKTPFVVFRANSGNFWAGTIKNTPEYGRILVNPRPVVGFPPGTPDLIALGPNAAAVFIEVKNDKGRVSKEQENFHAMLRRYGFRVCVARSAEEAIEVINGGTRHEL